MSNVIKFSNVKTTATLARKLDVMNRWKPEPTLRWSYKTLNLFQIEDPTKAC